MIQLYFFGEKDVPKQIVTARGDRAAQIAKLKRAVDNAEREVWRLQDDLDDAADDLEKAEEELENFLTNGTTVDSEIAWFGKAMLSRERYLSGAAREIIEGILYDSEPVAPLLEFAQNYGWEIPRSVMDAARTKL